MILYKGFLIIGFVKYDIKGVSSFIYNYLWINEIIVGLILNM